MSRPNLFLYLTTTHYVWNNTLMTEQSGENGGGLFGTILSIIGMIIIGIIVLWGLFHLVSLLVPSLSNLMSRIFSRSDAIEITLSPESVQSGSPLDISWTHRAKEAGSYSFMYQCRDGFQFRTPNASGALTNIPCGSPFAAPENVKTMRIVPILSGMRELQVPVSIAFTPSAGDSGVIEGTATAVVKNQSGATLPATTTPSRPTTSRPSTSTAPKTPADLRVQILSVGVLESNGSISNRYPSNQNDIAAVRFRVSNAGGSASGNWYFTSTLPVTSQQLYTSPAQASMGAGYSGEYILQFRPVQAGGGTFTVYVDAGNAVKESNESNNTASITIPMQYWTGSYQPYTPYIYSY